MANTYFATFVVLAGSTILLSQQHPNFSGTWNLNSGASDFSDKGALEPDSLVLTIQQKEEALTYRMEKERNGRRDEFGVSLMIGGAPHHRGSADTTAEWNGDKLEIKILYKPGADRHTDEVETWSLTPDGRRLIDDLISHSQRKEDDVHVRRVFDKQR